jgi:hypothetical protein
MKIVLLTSLLILISACGSAEREGSTDPSLVKSSTELKELQSACNSGSGKDCDQLATQLMDRQSTEDQQKILAILEKACNYGYMPSCTHLGNIHATPIVAEEDFTKAAEFYEKACAAGEQNACSALAQLYFVGQGVEQDHKKSAALSEQACAHNYASACNILGTQYTNGDGVQQSNDKALELFKKACELKNEASCQSLSKLQNKLHRYD